MRRHKAHRTVVAASVPGQTPPRLTEARVVRGSGLKDATLHCDSLWFHWSDLIGLFETHVTEAKKGSFLLVNVANL